MKYGVYRLVEYDANKQCDDSITSIIKCNTVRELKEALIPHVERIAKKYEDCCYGTITVTIDSFRNEIYELEQTVCHISPFCMDMIDNIVEDILGH
jgi:hypothetical protein